ncbi:MAG: polyphosphate kinase [Gammaproteobacteria bacterium AqS3]|nr:polyphosphate kinase [Gammaproteobacteria bacterium AqS3]
MQLNNVRTVQAPYSDISVGDYKTEKHRLQVELLSIQQNIIKHNRRLAVVFEGRDAAGKGSTIKCFTENMIPHYLRVIALGKPTPKESKYWLRRYETRLPKPQQVTFFDRSWYSRALIEPTMGYCSEGQYRHFMKRVLPWEHQLIDEGLLLIKFYLSVDQQVQMQRFEERLSNPLTYWKFSPNDLEASKLWEKFSYYKEQMFRHTASERSPWVVIVANKKREARLTAMLHLVRLFSRKTFKPLTGERVEQSHNIELFGVPFSSLSERQLAALKHAKAQEERAPVHESDPE